MAEGGAEEVVLDDRNGSFQNQSEEGRGNRTTSFFLLFSVCWCLVIPVVRFLRGDSFFFLSSAHADTVSMLARQELPLLVEASSDWF